MRNWLLKFPNVFRRLSVFTLGFYYSVIVGLIMSTLEFYHRSAITTVASGQI